MRVLSGIQPSGELHIGNYFGMMKPMIEYQETSSSLLYVKLSGHDLCLRRSELPGAPFRCPGFYRSGHEPRQGDLLVQGDVPEVTELTWILNNVTPVGLLLRSHSYKDKTAQGIAPTMGFYPPVLMARTSCLPGERVPVGRSAAASGDHAGYRHPVQRIWEPCGARRPNHPNNPCGRNRRRR